MNAIYTVQHNEQFYLPKWIKYYSKHFEPENMHILAHNCSGQVMKTLEKAEKMGINVEYINTDDIFNHDWLTGLVHQRQKLLLEKYKYVVYTDCDEFIVPRNCTLKEFLDNADQLAYRCLGYDAILDKVFPNPRFFDKTLITSIPLTYEHGYHSSIPEFPVNQDLLLFHIHRMDYDEAWERNQRLAQEKWDKKALDQGQSIQNQLKDKEAFDKWFYDNQDKLEYSELYSKLVRELKTISIVSSYYNKEEMTVDFLNNLEKYTQADEVILTNANSKPIEHPFITERVDLDHNESFAHSMNNALKKATGDYVILLGNDVFPHEGWAETLIELAERTGAYITAPLNEQSNPSHYVKCKQFDDYFETDMFPAVCWVISKTCLKSVGLFDEQFKPGCYEDNDYCRRVVNDGGRIVVSKLVNVGHLVSRTISQFDISQMMQENYQRYVKKWS